MTETTHEQAEALGRAPHGEAGPANPAAAPLAPPALVGRAVSRAFELLDRFDRATDEARLSLELSRFWRDQGDRVTALGYQAKAAAARQAAHQVVRELAHGL